MDRALDRLDLGRPVLRLVARAGGAARSARGRRPRGKPWHPDGEQILFSMAAGGGPRLFTFDLRKPGPPILLPGQPLNHFISNADWSSDGKQIVFSSQVLPGDLGTTANR